MRRSPLTVSSNYARLNADIVALAASIQFITTRVSKGTYSRSWQITTKGLTALDQKDYT